jgi:hypothetical protein
MTTLGAERPQAANFCIRPPPMAGDARAHAGRPLRVMSGCRGGLELRQIIWHIADLKRTEAHGGFVPESDSPAPRLALGERQRNQIVALELEQVEEEEDQGIGGTVVGGRLDQVERGHRVRAHPAQFAVEIRRGDCPGALATTALSAIPSGRASPTGSSPQC